MHETRSIGFLTPSLVQGMLLRNHREKRPPRIWFLARIPMKPRASSNHLLFSPHETKLNLLKWVILETVANGNQSPTKSGVRFEKNNSISQNGRQFVFLSKANQWNPTILSGTPSPSSLPALCNQDTAAGHPEGRESVNLGVVSSKSIHFHLLECVVFVCWFPLLALKGIDFTTEEIVLLFQGTGRFKLSAPSLNTRPARVKMDLHTMDPLDLGEWASCPGKWKKADWGLPGKVAPSYFILSHTHFTTTRLQMARAVFLSLDQPEVRHVAAPAQEAGTQFALNRNRTQPWPVRSSCALPKKKP